MTKIHATLISYQNKGILLGGESGVGKSDLALRFIMDKGAKLVADDYVELLAKEGVVYGSAPESISGKMEIRGVGIANFETKHQEKICLYIELCHKREEIERLPEQKFIELEGIMIEKISLCAFDCSTICKIIAKISGIIC